MTVYYDPWTMCKYFNTAGGAPSGKNLQNRNWQDKKQIIHNVLLYITKFSTKKVYQFTFTPIVSVFPYTYQQDGVLHFDFCLSDSNKMDSQCIWIYLWVNLKHSLRFRSDFFVLL